MLAARHQHRRTRLLAGFLFFSSPSAFKPDLRHWSDNLFEAAPPYAAYEGFLSNFDFDESQEKLETQAKEREEKIEQAEAIDKAGLSPGQAYHAKKILVDLLQQQNQYLQFAADRDDYLKEGSWRRPSGKAEKPSEARKKLNASYFKTLELTRALVNNAVFDGPENLALLVRLLGRTHNDNIILFSDQFQKKYQNSPLLAQVHHSLGEYYAQSQEWDKAESKFKMAMENKNSPLRPYSVYRLGWTHIMRVANEQDAKKREEGLKKAHTAFKLCLKLMKDWDLYDPAFDLKREVMTDMAWLMAETRTPIAAVKKFLDEQDGEKSYPAYLSYLAADAARDGDFALAEATFKELLPLQAESRELPRTLLNVSEKHLLAREYLPLVASYESYRKLFEGENPWLKKWGEDKELREVSLKQLAQHIASAASRSYQEAEKTPEAPLAASDAKPKPHDPLLFVTETKPEPMRSMLFALSKELYRLYGSWYPKGEALEEARYNEALTHFYTGSLEKSLELLSAIAADEKSPFRQQASYNAVLVAVNYDQQQAPPKLPASGKAKEIIPFSKSRALLIERIDSFLKLSPEADDKVTLQYMAAQSFYEYGNYSEAIKRFDVIVQNAPETEQGESSLHTMLGYEVEAGLWADVIDRCKSYLKNKKITGAGHRKILRQTLEYAKGQVGASAS